MDYRNIKDLNKLPNNPRRISEDDFERLKKSINDNPDYFEARPLILSNRTGKLVIIAGNQRYEAAKALKLEKVPKIIILDELTGKRRSGLLTRLLRQSTKRAWLLPVNMALKAIRSLLLTLCALWLDFHHYSIGATT
jgi:ParB-like chromosome segregation protein Spo0J